MPETGRAWRLGLCALLLLLPGLLGAAPRIGLLTMAPGEEYWARYGHNALLVVEGERATSYNYGYFDFEQPGFLARFLRGDMRYRLVALPYQVDMASYAAEGRSVHVQWLDLDPPAAAALALALAENALPENAEYRYDYFLANCSTKLRDAIDGAIDGELRRQSQSRSHGLSWRSESLRLSSPLAWMALGIHFGLGPATDRPLSRWEEAFVPQRLADTLREVRIDGRPLVSAEAELIAPALPPAPEQAPAWLPWFALAGAALLALLALVRMPSGSLAQRLGVATLAMLWLACGLAGLGLLALWLGSDHWAAWRNANLLLANPLCLALLPILPALWRGQPPPRWASRLAIAVAACAALAVFIGWVQMRSQQHGEWIVLLLPAHLMLALTLDRLAGKNRAGLEPV